MISSEIRKLVTESLDDPSFKALSALPADVQKDAVLRDQTKLIAFYLPQFHRIPENSEWWGPGFTEWTNVARGRPNFQGHVQPKIPRELGYYDLSSVGVMAEQADLARTYGLHGFCFYHYWFGGRRILEKPVDQFLASDIDFSFCLCWANENWTRTWDGEEKDILLRQGYGQDDAVAFIRDLMPYLADPRYIRVNGAPLIVVYRAKEIPDPAAWFQTWKSYAASQGIADLHICAVDFYDIETAREVGADALVEFPPHKFNGPQTKPETPPGIVNPLWRGGLVDYSRIIAQSANRPSSREPLYRGIMPGWDNTARRQNNPTVVVNSSPEKYEEWLRFLRRQAQAEHADPDQQLIFVNAWNEWGEGCYLEPDQECGLGYLESTLRTSFLDRNEADIGIDGARKGLFEFLDAAESANGDDSLRRRQRRSVGAARSGHSASRDWEAIKPPPKYAMRISKALLRWPWLHRLAARAYKLGPGKR